MSVNLDLTMKVAVLVADFNKLGDDLEVKKLKQ